MEKAVSCPTALVSSGPGCLLGLSQSPGAVWAVHVPSGSHKRCEMGAGETLPRQFCLALSLQHDAPPTPCMCLRLKLVHGFCHAKAKCSSSRESFHGHHLIVT